MLAPGSEALGSTAEQLTPRPDFGPIDPDLIPPVQNSDYRNLLSAGEALLPDEIQQDVDPKLLAALAYFHQTGEPGDRPAPRRLLMEVTDPVARIEVRAAYTAERFGKPNDDGHIAVSKTIGRKLIRANILDELASYGNLILRAASQDSGWSSGRLATLAVASAILGDKPAFTGSAWVETSDKDTACRTIAYHMGNLESAWTVARRIKSPITRARTMVDLAVRGRELSLDSPVEAVSAFASRHKLNVRSVGLRMAQVTGERQMLNGGADYGDPKDLAHDLVAFATSHQEPDEAALAETLASLDSLAASENYAPLPHLYLQLFLKTKRADQAPSDNICFQRALAAAKQQSPTAETLMADQERDPALLERYLNILQLRIGLVTTAQDSGAAYAILQEMAAIAANATDSQAASLDAAVTARHRANVDARSKGDTLEQSIRKLVLLAAEQGMTTDMAIADMVIAHHWSMFPNTTLSALAMATNDTRPLALTAYAAMDRVVIAGTTGNLASIEKANAMNAHALGKAYGAYVLHVVRRAGSIEGAAEDIATVHKSITRKAQAKGVVYHKGGVRDRREYVVEKAAATQSVLVETATHIFHNPELNLRQKHQLIGLILQPDVDDSFVKVELPGFHIAALQRGLENARQSHDHHTVERLLEQDMPEAIRALESPSLRATKAIQHIAYLQEHGLQLQPELVGVAVTALRQWKQLLSQTEDSGKRSEDKLITCYLQLVAAVSGSPQRILANRFELIRD